MKSFIILGSVLTGIAIIIGAFGSHAIKTKVLPEDLAIFETGIKYHFYHSLGLIIIGILGFHYPHEVVQSSGKLFILGILIFSGSLYLLVLTNLRWLGAITPIGGFCFIMGWFILAYNIYKT
jgi:uncharacterized membrane protein YgdD (TMEM256/DUF423 family)